MTDLTVTLPNAVDMPLLGFGTWQLRGRTAYESVRRALDIGYRHIDTATMYRNEAEIGRALKDSGVPRSEVFLTTKLWPSDAGRERRALQASLAALGTDQLDLWLIHWPVRGGSGVPVWNQLVAAQQDGLTRAIGVSNYGTRQIDELTDATGVTPAVNQIEWSPHLYNARHAEELRSRGVVLEGYSPFKASRMDDAVLIDAARRHGVTTAQVILRWHLEHQFVAIPRSTNPQRIAANFDVFGFTLEPDEVARIDELGVR